MTFDIGIDFRATAIYVTDPANCTYSIGESYPTTRGGVTFGWLNSPGGNIRNRSTSVDPRIAGINYHSNAIKNKFQLDLPSSGSVDVYCAVGDAVQGSLSAYLEIFDDTTSLGVIVSKHTGMSADVFYDATDTSYSAANWPGSNAKATFTFATTKLIAAVSPGDSVGSNFVISHLRAAQVDSAIALTGAASTQANTASTAAITQAHVLVGATSTQGNMGSGAAITLGVVNTLVGAASTQDNTSGTGAIAQTHVLTASTSTNNGTSSAIAITQVHILSGAIATQGNLGGADAISILVPFVGAPSTQANISGVGQITRTQTLTGANAAQANLSGTGAVSDGIVVEASLSTGIASTIRIKKPGIPAGTPEWLRTTLEIVIGRRGNKITPPAFQTLTFSATPTKAECEALYSYTNDVRTAVESILTRLDS